MKKLCSYILCICLTLGIAASSFAYSDITEDYSWAEEAIEALSENNTINGYPDGTFLPEKNVSKAELAKMVCMLFGYGKQVQYSDVSKDGWYYDFVSQSGGYFVEEDEFFPNRFATREEVAYAVYSAMQLGALPTDKKISFPDQDEIANTYLAAVKFLNEQAIITGYPDGSFRPKNPITRAETAVILYRAHSLKNIAPTPEPSPEEKETAKANNYFFLVTKVATVLDDSGEIATKVTGYNEGVLEELILKDSVTINHSIISSGTALKAGDLISFTRDFFGAIRSVSVGLNLSELLPAYRMELLTYGNNRKQKILYGIVERRYQSKGIELRSADNATQKLYTLTNDVSVCLWKNGKAELSDVYEINDSTYETGDTVVAYCYEDEISSIIIIR